MSRFTRAKRRRRAEVAEAAKTRKQGDVSYPPICVEDTWSGGKRPQHADGLVTAVRELLSANGFGGVWKLHIVTRTTLRADIRFKLKSSEHKFFIDCIVKATPAQDSAYACRLTPDTSISARKAAEVLAAWLEVPAATQQQQEKWAAQRTKAERKKAAAEAKKAIKEAERAEDEAAEAAARKKQAERAVERDAEREAARIEAEKPVPLVAPAAGKPWHRTLAGHKVTHKELPALAAVLAGVAKHPGSLLSAAAVGHLLRTKLAVPKLEPVSPVVTALVARNYLTPHQPNGRTTGYIVSAAAFPAPIPSANGNGHAKPEGIAGELVGIEDLMAIKKKDMAALARLRELKQRKLLLQQTREAAVAEVRILASKRAEYEQKLHDVDLQAEERKERGLAALREQNQCDAAETEIKAERMTYKKPLKELAESMVRLDRLREEASA